MTHTPQPVVTHLHVRAIDNSHLNNQKAPVLFLHGFGAVGAQWWGLQTTVSYVAPTFAFDLPGHGESLSFPYAGSPKVAARAVIAAMVDHDLNRVHLVGHSMGGAIASLIALIVPERVMSLTMLAPGGYGPEVNHALLLKWAGARGRREIAELLPEFFGPGFLIKEKMIDFQCDVRARPGAVETLTGIVGKMFQEGRQGVLPIDDILALPMPKTVIWGRKDNVVPVEQSQRLQGHVDLIIGDQMGHSPLEEAPGLVRNKVMKQVRKLR